MLVGSREDECLRSRVSGEMLSSSFWEVRKLLDSAALLALDDSCTATKLMTSTVLPSVYDIGMKVYLFLSTSLSAWRGLLNPL